MSDEPGDDYRRLREVYARHLRTTDFAPLDAVLAVATTADWPGDPLWCYVVGSPSSGKTEILRAFDGLDETYFLSSLKPASLVSGLKDGQDLLPKLDGKALLIKDLSPVLEMHRENRDEIFATLRDAFDGTFVKAFGTRGTVRYDSHFNLAACVTSAIEDYYSAQAVLGQRFLLVRTHFPAEYSADDARDVDAMRAELHDGVESVIRNRKRLPDRPPISRELAGEVKDLAAQVAVLRTHVDRDRFHEIRSFPEPEAPARLANQLLKLARGLAAVRAKSDVTGEELDSVRRVARDTIPKFRVRLLEAVREGERTVDGIAMGLGIPRRTIERKVEDLVVLGIVHEDSSGKPYIYTPTRDFSLLRRADVDSPANGEAASVVVPSEAVR